LAGSAVHQPDHVAGGEVLELGPMLGDVHVGKAERHRADGHLDPIVDGIAQGEIPGPPVDVILLVGGLEVHDLAPGSGSCGIGRNRRSAPGGGKGTDQHRGRDRRVEGPAGRGGGDQRG
jgi:hypothetical protein